MFYRFNPQWTGGRPYAERKFVNREAFEKIMDHMEDRQALCIIGPRRTGKTTILQQILIDLWSSGVNPARTFYFSFDEILSTSPDILDEIIYFYADQVLKDSKEERAYIFLDEVQHIEHWQAILKRHYDILHPNFKLLVSGSSGLSIRKKGAESLAGRIFDFTIWPLSFREYISFRAIKAPKHKFPESFEELQTIHDSYIPHLDEITIAFNDYLLRGGFPETVEMTTLARCQEYIRTSVVEKAVLRDLGMYAPIDNPKILLEILQILAAQSSGLFEIQNLASTLSLNRGTVSRYIVYLELAYLISISHNLTKSRVKQARSAKKVYVTDTGMITALSGLGNDLLGHPSELGHVVETAVRNHFARRHNTSFWRDRNKNEVDIVIKQQESLLPIEVKFRESIRSNDLKSLKEFIKVHDTKLGIIATKKTLAKKDGIWLVPVWLLLILQF